MDSLTHIVFGATLGEVVLGKKIGKKALLFGAIANTIPDLDVFLVFGDPIREITIHRGFSHSIVFPFLIAPFLAWLAFRFMKDPVSWKEWFLFFFVLILTHPLLDSLTAYGTQLFLPFSDFRVNFSNLFIVDVVFTLPMLLAAISLWIMKRNNGGRQNLARRALIISGLYVFLSLSAKLYVNGVFSESLVKKGIQSTHQMTGNTPFNILLWYTVAEVDSGYFVGDYSLLDPDQNIPYLFLRRNEHLLEGYRNEYATDRMIWFSNHFYSVEKVKNETRFFTLKFGMTGFDLSRPLSESVPFYYRMTRNPDGTVKVETERRIKDLKLGDTFSRLYKRVMGNRDAFAKPSHPADSVR